ncbi:hypothetical protein HGRIS_012147 [Hohenbuehelia grisea]|uniref:Uncharacterized protein n=1 Tax=Hohenbuehelia grisea TaxID=104357 RepID=A0ABR3IRF3_9AGAR
MGISLDKAELLAIFLETLLYGIFFTLYCVTLLVLHQRGHAGHTLRRKLVPVATILLVIATAHLTIDFVRIVQAFIEFKDANAYYARIAHPLHVAKTALYATQTVIGDGVIIWRCYVIYKKSLFVIIPTSILLAMNACAGYVVTWSLSKATPGSDIFETASAWITTFFVLTMCINVICTGAIVWRIYWTRRAVISAQGSLFPVALAIVESGAVYATGVLGSLIAYLTGSNGQYTALDVITPLVGIAFSLIILQIRFHLSSGSQNTSTSVTQPEIISWKQQRSRGAVSGMEQSSRGIPLQPLSIHITEQREEGYPAEAEKSIASESKRVSLSL